MTILSGRNFAKIVRFAASPHPNASRTGWLMASVMTTTTKQLVSGMVEIAATSPMTTLTGTNTAQPADAVKYQETNALMLG